MVPHELTNIQKKGEATSPPVFVVINKLWLPAHLGRIEMTNYKSSKYYFFTIILVAAISLPFDTIWQT